jgi:hypothetical protein
MISPATIIFISVIVIAVVELSSMALKREVLNKTIKFSLILLCLGLIVYFNVDRNSVSESLPQNQKADSLENVVRLLHTQIDSFNNRINQKNDSNKNNVAIIRQQKDSLASIKDKNSVVINKNARDLTDELKSEFKQDLQHYFSKYNLPANTPINITCRMGDDNAYNFAEKLSIYLKASGYTINPITNKMQLRSKAATSMDMDLKDNRVEINMGSTDITPANQIVVQ